MVFFKSLLRINLNKIGFILYLSLASLTVQAEDIQLMILNQDSLPVPYAQVRLENGAGLVADIQGRVALPHSFKEQVVTVKVIATLSLKSD